MKLYTAADSKAHLKLFLFTEIISTAILVFLIVYQFYITDQSMDEGIFFTLGGLVLFLPLLPLLRWILFLKKNQQ